MVFEHHVAMTRREIAALVCQAIALLVFAYAAFFGVGAILAFVFAFLSMPFRGWTDWNELYAAMILSVPFVATLIVAIVYWKTSDSIASKMVSDDPTPVTTFSIDVQDIMMVAFSTAGVFILVDGVRDFVAIVYLAHDADFTAREFWYNHNTWSALIELGLALWLVLGSRGIVRLIHWLRTAGKQNAEEEGRSQDDAP